MRDRIKGMDKIQEAAVHFLNMVNTTSYVFHLANRNVRVVSLNFMAKDFHHMAGFQYLTDINIPRDKKKTISWILKEDNPITDEYLAQSKFYQGKPNDEKDVENRIAQLQFLEQYLDENNIIRIYSPKDGPQNNSLIECDYIIESQLPDSLITVYIFLRYRDGIGSPCAIISFVVKKNVTYGGDLLPVSVLSHHREACGRKCASREVFGAHSRLTFPSAYCIISTIVLHLEKEG